jgi:DNA-binding response OmpR family regulator
VLRRYGATEQGRYLEGQVALPPCETEPMINSKRILLVEDNEDLALLLSENLEERGHTVRVAHDGVSALRIAQEFEADLAILDMGLPGISGCDLAKQLRTLRPHHVPRLFAVSGFGSDQDRAMAKEIGFERYFVKPVMPQVLERAVDELEESRP